MSTAACSLNNSSAKMLEAADACGCVVERARLLLGQRDQVFHRSDRRCRVDHQHVGAGREYRDRGERFDRIVFKRVERRIDRVRDRYHADRVAVGRGVGASFGSDRAAGAAAVVDINLLPQFDAQLCATSRPTTSLLPPGGNGMINRTGRFGYLGRCIRQQCKEQRCAPSLVATTMSA